MKGVQNGVDIQRLKCPRVRQCTSLVSNIQRAIIEPDVRFDRDRTDRDGAIEGHISPIVVVTVDQLRYDALGQACWVGIEWCLVTLIEDVLQCGRDVGIDC